MNSIVIREAANAYLNDIKIYEYTYPRLSSGKFTYHKHPNPRAGNRAKDNEKWLDNGTCEVCGRKGTYTLIEVGKPAMCYKCYQAVRAYRNLKLDVLHKHKKKTLTMKDIKEIVSYMNSYSKKKSLILTAIGIALIQLMNNSQSKK